MDNKESVQYEELVTELTTEVRHCLLGVGKGRGRGEGHPGAGGPKVCEVQGAGH